ncbi:MAG: prepilin-type N-terminal cleavage/methylation domain-containing protein [Elusimicrobiaceae bacterium]|nr:prepilin-type N-terminal cleavage/methylation domain-containing protein [Elusimicrobiaceae bacterium]
MKNNKGFTLMEVLLAALIVGVIGIALAALTTAAVREGGVGRTRVMLRHQLSLAMQQLRQDIAFADQVGVEKNADGTVKSVKIKHMHPQGEKYIGVLDTPMTVDHPVLITYEFTKKENSNTGGIIKRKVEQQGAQVGKPEIWLSNIKTVSQSGFISPRFEQITNSGDQVGSLLKVSIIVEVGTDPVVNDVIVETFAMQHGFPVVEEE